MDVMVEIKNLSKTYDGKNMVLDKFSYIFDKGRFYAIMGRSGAGKSTLLNIIGTIDCITEGEVLVAGKNVTGLKEKEKAEKLGLMKQWKRYVEATGEISRIGYREEVEAAMRTEDMSGISLLGLQDFPGQGTALVGMINSHMESKPFDFAKPEHFASFSRAQLPLVALPKYT